MSFYGNQVPSDAASQPLSAAALLSILILFLLIIPILPQIIGAALAWIGLRHTRDGTRTGRRLALVGLVANLLVLILWISTIAFSTISILQMIDASETAEQWVDAMQAGDIGKAHALSAPDFTDERLETAMESLRPYRAREGDPFLVPNSFALNTAMAFGALDGIDGDDTSYELRLRYINGEWRVVRFRLFDSNATTKPAKVTINY